MEPAIRDFRNDDIDRVLDYRRQSAAISFPGLTIDMDGARRSILEHAKKYPGTIKVAEVNGDVAGFIRFAIEDGVFGPYGLVYVIFVDGPHRRRGVGHALLKAAESHLRSAGVSSIEATVTKTNAESLEFFMSHGYAERRVVLNKTLD